MSKRESNSEINQMHRLLIKTAELAERSEQTGVYEGGAAPSVRRYNQIIEHLEESGTLPPDLFPALSVEETQFGVLGAECRLLADYLFADRMEREEERGHGRERRDDMNILIGLAPFLGQEELRRIVHRHYPDPPSPSEERAKTEEPPQEGMPRLKDIVQMAPHLDSKTLTDLVGACLLREKTVDPKQFVQLAPFMEAEDFGRMLRQYFPNWFQGVEAPHAPPHPPTPPTPPHPPSPNWNESVNLPQPGRTMMLGEKSAQE